MFFYMSMGIIIAMLSSVYLTWFVYRFLITILSLSLNKWFIIPIFIVCALISLPARNFFSLYTIIYYHLIVISIFLEIFNIFLSKYQIFNFTYKSGILSILITVMIIGYGFYNMNSVVKTDVNFSSSKVNDLTIVQITDLHMGITMSLDGLQEHCDDISALNPDLLVLTGDIFDESTTKHEMEEATRILGSVQTKLGSYYVYGNHDTQPYIEARVFDGQMIRDEFEKYGVTVLNDEVTTIDNVTIVGRADASFAGTGIRKTTEELLTGVNKDNFILLLDHQPLELDINKEAGVDLQLSGHTHGGQIWPAGILESFVTTNLVYGSYEDEDFKAYTSSGIAGWGFPIKTGAPSEYVYITIK